MSGDELGAELAAELWRRGKPTLALLDSGKPGCADGGQLGWVQRFQRHGGHGVWNIGRQRGKTFAGLVLDAEICLSKPGAVVRFAAKTAKSARAIIEPSLQRMLEHCPPELRPQVDNERGLIRWPNGSVIVWAGVDAEQFDRLRGPFSDHQHLTEVAFWAPGDLERVEGALLPQLITTRGHVLYESSPPESPGHPFVARYRAAQANGRAEHDTIEGNPRLTPEDVEHVLRADAERLGMTLEEFRASTYCRREYFAEIVTESSRAALPGWTQAVADECVVESARPAHFNAFVAIDWGGYTGDPHAALFGYQDFLRRELCIEDELEMRGVDLRTFLGAVKEKERALWGVDGWTGTLHCLRDWPRENVPEWLAANIMKTGPRQPYLRVTDNDEALMVESLGHGVAVLPSAKHDKHLWVDALDVTVRRRGLRVHPRCVRLREQLFTTVWDKQRNKWERTAKDHGDLLDCAVYMHRNTPWHLDPRPKHRPNAWEQGLAAIRGEQKSGLESLFARRRR